RVHVEVAVQPTGALAPAERNDPFEPVYARTLANYAQGRGWRRSAAGARGPGAPRAGRATLAQEVVPDTSVFVGRPWVKIKVPSAGFYKLDFGTLRNLPPFQGVTPALSDLRLFTWPGYPVLPEGSYCDSCDYREVS